MKKSVKVSELSHEELVTFFSDAIYGNHIFSISTNVDEGAVIPTNIGEIEANFNGTYCREDKWADILLNGGTIVVVDSEAMEGYPIDLNNVFNGFAKAYEVCPQAMARVETFEGDADLYDSDEVLQCVVFGEVIYG